MGWGGWVAMALGMIVFWGLSAVGVVLIIRSVGHRHDVAREPAGRTAALRSLDDRFTQGEIDADEYSRAASC